ncbi:MAG: PQQ-dependent sugar dehydrogenase [Pirellulaceae bacterium]|nr:PQQ-dependent sugar dehydrogenase [Pirellulaceae bacterium]
MKLRLLADHDARWWITWFSFWLTAATVLAIPGTACPGEPNQNQGPTAADGSTATGRSRVPWSTSRFRGRPEPPPPYRAERLFPKLNFQQPTVLTSAPGTDRWFVAEHSGKIYSIPPDPDCAAADLLIDVKQLVEQLAAREREELELEAVYGLTFHPRFAENRQVYVCYVARYRDRSRGQHPAGTRVCRLQVSQSDPPRCDPQSEQLVIDWLQGGHNGGCLKFGRDGCLYISTGDGGFAFPPDGLNAGQDVTNLLSAVLRIDVDQTDGERAYRIPADNPFVELPGARGEIWAYGMRNPWKMSFDRQTGELWVGDVGWELWELVYRVRKADNFGWSLVEGRQPVHAERRRGPTPIVPPAVEIPHTDGASITGGFVYRGRRFPELVGTYVFGDWETRRIWGVEVRESDVGPRRELVDPTVRIVGFAEDQAGELYLLDYDDGTIHGLERNETSGVEQQFPRRLSETGIFASVERHQPAAGVLPFAINAPQWSDHARAERLIGVPGTGSIALHASPNRVAGSMFNRSLDFPADSVLVKTLSLDLAAGDPASRRRVETQILHFDGRDWRGYTYRWNQQQTDAELVPAEGDAQTLTVADPQAPGGQRTHDWRFPSRMECIRCHNPWAEHSLAFNVAQLNRPLAADSTGASASAGNQLQMLFSIGLLRQVPEPVDREQPQAGMKPPRSVEQLPRLANPADEASDLDARARAYLHANCAHCHRDGGGGSAYLHLPYDKPLSDTKTLGLRPTQGTFGIHDAELLAPGDPYRSVLYYRMAKSGAGHMPHLGARMIDQQGLELIHDWIRQLPVRLDDAQRIQRLIQLDAPAPPDEMDPRAVEQARRQTEQRRQLVAELLASPASALLLVRSIRAERLPPATRQFVLDAAAAHTQPETRDLFEPLLPEDQRWVRLGEKIAAADILSLTGDAQRGRSLFHEAQTVQCRNCHRLGPQGRDVGPDLTQIGKKYDRAKLLENILEPSKDIDHAYVTWLAETTDGKVYAGLMVERGENEVVLKDAENKLQRLPVDRIEGLYPQQKSLMPDLLLRDMTAQQVADLLAYLESLK